MRVQRPGVLLCLLLSLAGCQAGLESVPETPPPAHGPELPPLAFRPTYELAGKGPVTVGMGFVVQDRKGNFYLLTAANVLESEAEWQQVQTVTLRTMEGTPVAINKGFPLLLGKPYTEINAAHDVMLWQLAEGAKITPAKLAAEDPKKNEWVWAVGQPAGQKGTQQLYCCKVTGASMGGLQIQQQDKFEMHGFRGGPIVNDQGEVVGSLLGGRGSTMIATRVSSLRQRLTEAKVELP